MKTRISYQLLLSLSLLIMLPAIKAQETGNRQSPGEEVYIVQARMSAQQLRVGGDGADIRGFTNLAIQLAIDALAETGGSVILDPGEYTIVSPVRMKSGIHLQGSGRETILKRGKGFQTSYVVDADYGELKVSVKDPSGFRVGMKVQVTDADKRSCWDVSTAYITAIEDSVLYIDRGLIRDYRSDRNGLISNASSVIEVIGAQDVLISDLVADGNREENYFADGCVSAGVLIYKSTDIVLDNILVKDFRGEGISWQTTERVSVRNCEITGSANTGLHPGTGSPYSTITGNNIHHNDRDGLFICWRVYKSSVTNNTIHHNGRFGICTGHKDSDVVFERNHIHHNGSDGVNLRPEREGNAPHRNTFVRNTIENNGSREGAYGFAIHSPARDLLLEENIFLNSSGTQKAAIFVHENGLKPRLVNNRFDEHELGEVLDERSSEE